MNQDRLDLYRQMMAFGAYYHELALQEARKFRRRGFNPFVYRHHSLAAARAYHAVRVTRDGYLS